MEVLDDGAFRFVRPDGRAFDSVAPARDSDWTQLPRQHRQRALKIDAHTAATRWRGERMDYGLALEILFAQAAQAGPDTVCA